MIDQVCCYFSADETEVSPKKLFEGDILLVDGDKPYGFRKKRSDMTSSNQEAEIMETDAPMGTGSPVPNHAWPNRTVYYTFGQTLGELLLIIIY